MILRNIADTLEVFSSTRVVWKPSFWPKHDIFMNPLFSDERSDLSWLISDSPFQRKAYHKRDEERQRESKICMFWCPREEPGCGAEPEAPRAAPALPSPRTGCRGVPTPCLSKQGARTGSHRSPHSPPAPPTLVAPSDKPLCQLSQEIQIEGLHTILQHPKLAVKYFKLQIY